MESLGLQQLEWLFIALIGLVLVSLVVLILYVVLANRRQRARMVQAHEADKITPRPALQVAGQVLSLVRDEEGEALKVEVHGDKYRRWAEIKDPQIRRQVVDAAFELIRFIGVLGEDAVSPVPIEKTHRWREDLRKDSQAQVERIRHASVGEGAWPQVPPAPKEVEAQFLNLLAEMGQSPAPPERPGVLSAVQQRLATKSAEAGPSRTFVDDIEDIIQRRAQLIPALVGRDLHVRIGPGGGVCFVFEGREFGNLEEVPNLTAQQLIKDAIREWDETT